MLVVEIVQKIRKGNVIDKIVLRDISGMFIMSYEELCKEVEKGRMNVIGHSLKLKDGKLDLQETKCMIKRNNNDTQIVIDRDLISLIAQNSCLEFKTVNNLSDEVLHSKGMAYKVSQNCFIENSNNTIRVISNKKFKIRNGYELFQDKQFESLDLSGVDTSDMISMERMFEGSSIGRLHLSCGNTERLASTKAMFMNSSINALSISSMQTRNVTNMSYMFCNSHINTLRLIRGKLNTHRVVDMTKMFFGCTDAIIQGLKVEDFNTSSLLSADYMFSKCTANKLNLSNWEISNELSAKGIFLESNIREINKGTLLNIES